MENKCSGSNSVKISSLKPESGADMWRLDAMGINEGDPHPDGKAAMAQFNDSIKHTNG